MSLINWGRKFITVGCVLSYNPCDTVNSGTPVNRTWYRCTSTCYISSSQYSRQIVSCIYYTDAHSSIFRTWSSGHTREHRVLSYLEYCVYCSTGGGHTASTGSMSSTEGPNTASTGSMSSTQGPHTASTGSMSNAEPPSTSSTKHPKYLQYSRVFRVLNPETLL